MDSKSTKLRMGLDSLPSVEHSCSNVWRWKWVKPHLPFDLPPGADLVGLWWRDTPTGFPLRGWKGAVTTCLHLHWVGSGSSEQRQKSPWPGRPQHLFEKDLGRVRSEGPHFEKDLGARTRQGCTRRPILEGSVGFVGEIGRRRRRHVVTTTDRVSLGLSGSLFKRTWEPGPEDGAAGPFPRGFGAQSAQSAQGDGPDACASPSARDTYPHYPHTRLSAKLSAEREAAADGRPGFAGPGAGIP